MKDYTPLFIFYQQSPILFFFFFYFEQTHALSAACLNISETWDLLGFALTTFSKVCREWRGNN